MRRASLTVACLFALALAAAAHAAGARAGNGAGADREAANTNTAAGFTAALKAIKTEKDLELFYKRTARGPPTCGEKEHSFTNAQTAEVAAVADELLAALKRAGVLTSSIKQAVTSLRDDVSSGLKLTATECTEDLKLLEKLAAAGTGGGKSRERRAGKKQKQGGGSISPQLLELHAESRGRAEAEAEDRDGDGNGQLVVWQPAPVPVQPVVQLLRFILWLAQNVFPVALDIPTLVAPFAPEQSNDNPPGLWATDFRMMVMHHLAENNHLADNPTMAQAATAWAANTHLTINNRHVLFVVTGGTTDLRDWLAHLRQQFMRHLSVYPSVLVSGGGPGGLAAALYARHGNGNHGARTVKVRESRYQYYRQHVISTASDVRGTANPGGAGGALNYKRFTAGANSNMRARHGLEHLLGDGANQLGAAPAGNADLRAAFRWHAVSAGSRYIKISDLEKLLCVIGHIVGIEHEFLAQPPPANGLVAQGHHLPPWSVAQVAAEAHGATFDVGLNAGNCAAGAATIPNPAQAVAEMTAADPADALGNKWDIVVIAEGAKSSSRAQYFSRTYGAFDNTVGQDVTTATGNGACAHGQGTSHAVQDSNEYVSPRTILQANQLHLVTDDVRGPGGDGDANRFGDNTSNNNERNRMKRVSEWLRGENGQVTLGFVIRRTDLAAGAANACQGIHGLVDRATLDNNVASDNRGVNDGHAHDRGDSVAASNFHYKAFSPVGGRPHCQLEVQLRSKAAKIVRRAMRCRNFNLNLLSSTPVADASTVAALRVMRRVFDRAFVGPDSDADLSVAQRADALRFWNMVVEFKQWETTGRMSVANRNAGAAHPLPQVGEIKYHVVHGGHRLQLFVGVGDAVREALPDHGMGANDANDNARRLGVLVETVHDGARLNADQTDAGTAATRDHMCTFLKEHTLHVRDTVYQIHRKLMPSIRELGYANSVARDLAANVADTQLHYA